MKKNISIFSILLILVICSVLYYLYKTNSILIYDYCDGEGTQCYVEEALSELSEDYSYAVEHQKCVPARSIDIFKISHVEPLHSVQPLDTGIKNILHYKVTLPSKLKLKYSNFSVIINTLEDKVYTGQMYLNQHKEIAGMVKKDPPYLSQIFDKFFQSHSGERKNSPIARYIAGPEQS